MSRLVRPDVDPPGSDTDATSPERAVHSESLAAPADHPEPARDNPVSLRFRLRGPNV